MKARAPALLAVLLLGAAATGSLWLWLRPAEPVQLIVGAPEIPPDTTWKPEGKVRGLAVDVLEEAARRGGYRLRWVNMDTFPGGCDAAIRQGRVDLCPAVGILPERKRQFHISRPWLRGDFCLVSRAETRVLQEEISPRITISHVNGPVTNQLVKRRLPHVQKIATKSRKDAVVTMCRGQSDAAFLDAVLFQQLLLVRPPECQGIPLYAEVVRGAAVEVGLAGPKYRAAVLDDLRGRIAEMRADRTLARAIKRWQPLWFGDTELMLQEQESRWQIAALRFGIAGAGILVLALVLMNRRIASARRAAERAAEARSEFIAAISHEIRTPLGGVLSTAELMKNCRMDDEARQYVDIILDSGKSLQHLLNDLLDLKKAEAGRLIVNAFDFPVRPVLQGVLDAFRGAATIKGITCRMEVEDSVPEVVRGDASRLRQLVWNLMSNAVKFTMRGEVCLRAKWRNGLRVEVEDTGVGIASSVMPRLFHKYVQAGPSVTGNFGGTGLGLALCKALVEAIGGKIGVQSQEGVGSLFWFELPWPEGAAPPPVAEQDNHGFPLPAPVPKAVLVAEDNPTNRMVIRRFLEKAGCQVDVVENGEQAVQQAATRRYDAIFMDCFMPVLDGYAAARQIRAEPGPSQDVPIVAITAAAMDSDRRKALQAGMNDYITKPLTAEDLLGALHRWAHPPEDTAGRDAAEPTRALNSTA
jgi:signal transduction histidine kinase/CheY-like chemotaxis protein